MEQVGKRCCQSVRARLHRQCRTCVGTARLPGCPVQPRRARPATSPPAARAGSPSSRTGRSRAAPPRLHSRAAHECAVSRQRSARVRSRPSVFTRSRSCASAARALSVLARQAITNSASRHASVSQRLDHQHGAFAELEIARVHQHGLPHGQLELSARPCRASAEGSASGSMAGAMRRRRSGRQPCGEQLLLGVARQHHVQIGEQLADDGLRIARGARQRVDGGHSAQACGGTSRQAAARVGREEEVPGSVTAATTASAQTPAPGRSAPVQSRPSVRRRRGPGCAVPSPACAPGRTMTVARWRVRLRARSRTRFLPLSFQGGTTGFETNKIDAMGPRGSLLRPSAPFLVAAWCSTVPGVSAEAA